MKDGQRIGVWDPIRKAAGKNGQGGFTLIELLVVISILGILAAVVTLSMVGITNIAQQRAKDAEKQTVQVAFDTMLADQGVSADSICRNLPQGSSAVGPPGTDNMEAFPVQAPYVQPNGKQLVALYPRYLRQAKTQHRYYCAALRDGTGTVTEDAGRIVQIANP